MPAASPSAALSGGAGRGWRGLGEGLMTGDMVMRHGWTADNRPAAP